MFGNLSERHGETRRRDTERRYGETSRVEDREERKKYLTKFILRSSTFRENTECRTEFVLVNYVGKLFCDYFKYDISRPMLGTVFELDRIVLLMYV